MRFKTPNHTLLAVMVLCLLSFCLVDGHAQVSLAQTNIWTTMPVGQLLQSANSGDAAAQYYYWVHEMNEAREMPDRAMMEQGVPHSNLTQADRDSLKTNWAAIPEAEVKQAAISGSYGAKYFLVNLASKAAEERALAAIEWARRSAAQEYPAAEYDVACADLMKLGWDPFPINQAEGLKFLQRSADHGLAAAQYLLATSYLGGQFFPTDFPKAIYYLQKAVDQNGPRSQYHLALLYANGNGQPRSEADSPLELLRKSAKSGYGPASYALGERYRIGLGVAVDYIKAIQLYQDARNRTVPDVTDLQRQAEEVFKLVDQNLEPKLPLPPSFLNFARALSLYLKATQNQDAAAMEQIGEWYQNGHFEPKDLVEAYRWLTLAAESGAPGAAGKRDALKSKLTPEQLEQFN